MTDKDLHAHKFATRNLSTQTVTLYPDRAQIVRLIQDIPLEAGLNEIAIYGLTPTTDESSIKIDGQGTATIIDMKVDLVPNEEKYEDIYPPSDSEEESSDVDLYSEIENYEEPLEARILAQESADLHDELERATEDRRSAASQLKMLEDFASSLKSSRPTDLERVVSAYREQRKEAFDRDFASAKLVKELEKKRRDWQKSNEKALRKFNRQKEIAQTEKAQVLQQRRQVVQDKRTAKLRRRNERAQFWPRKVYQVTLSLDTKSSLTPASSRRGSVESERTCLDPQRVSLSLTYTTRSAWWTPRYDLSLDTTQKTGRIIYRAESFNTTSETWTDAKVIISTSRTNFQDLGEPIPQMLPWYVHLDKGQGIDATNGALRSNHELQYRFKTRKDLSTYAKRMPSRNTLFGLDLPLPTVSSPMKAIGEVDKDMGFGLFDDGPAQKTIIPNLPPLSEPEPSWSEVGLTTSYDLPSPHTLAPSSTQHRHHIASIPLSNTVFSYIITPKLRAAAFLKVDIRNTSMITILKGSAGITVDGTFLGDTELPRCNSNESLSLNLGVDPNVVVTYAQPAVKRSQVGVFTKDACGVYRRTCTVTNTRTDRAVEGKVLEQIPMSEDERLRIEVLQPDGLSKEGNAVSSGTPLGEGKVSGKGWGHATASLGKDGEIAWAFKIGPGRGARFMLEYAARFPSGETVVAAQVEGSVQEEDEEDEDEDMGFGLFD